MGKAATLTVLSLFISILLPLQAGLAQVTPGKESAAAVFKRTLAEDGIEAAVARFREMMADTSGAYAFARRSLP
jgi:hypothetical protein